MTKLSNGYPWCIIRPSSEDTFVAKIVSNAFSGNNLEIILSPCVRVHEVGEDHRWSEIDRTDHRVLRFEGCTIKVNDKEKVVLSTNIARETVTLVKGGKLGDKIKALIEPVA